MTSFFRNLWLWLLLITFVFAADGESSSKYPKEIQIEGKTLILNGSGLCEYGFFKIDLYTAALYLEQNSTNPLVIMNSKQTKRIVLRFVYDLTREQMKDAYRASFKANSLENVFKRRIKILLDWMEPMDKGDYLAFTYVPDKGIEVDCNGTIKGQIEGDDFAKGIMQLYVGAYPPDKNLRLGLLRGGR